MGRFVGAILVVGLTIYIAMIYGSAAIAMFAMAEVLFVVITLVFMIYQYWRIRFALELPIAIAEQGQQVALRIKAENISIFGCPKVRCRIVSSNGFSHKQQKLWVWAGFESRKENFCQFEICPQDAGGYEIALDRVRVYDLSGIFYLDRKTRSMENLEVIPEIHQVQLKITEGMKHFFGDSEVYDDLHPGNDPSETFQIREFQEGDKIQSIHWKLSARTDELMVREYGQPKACPVVLILDAKSGWNGDGALKIVTSIAFSLMDAGYPHYIAWYSVQQQDMIRIRVDSEESFYLFLAHYLKAGDTRSPRPVTEQYDEKYRAEVLLHKLVINSDLELFQDGDLLVTMEESKIAEQLEGIELIL